MSKNLVIVGHSGFGKEIEWLIHRINYSGPKYNIIGYVDKKQDNEVIGDDEWLINYGYSLNVVIAISDCELRRKLYNKYRQNDKLIFPNIIDETVVKSDLIEYGKGNIICANSIVTIDITFGDFNIINLNSTIGHNTRIGNFVTLNPSVNVSGNVCIQDCTNVGTGVQILQGINVGECVVIGAGAVVNKDIPMQCTAVGVPAKVIKNNGQ